LSHERIELPTSNPLPLAAGFCAEVTVAPTVGNVASNGAVNEMSRMGSFLWV